MVYESEPVEFKQSLTEDIAKEVIAFANTHGGTIYLGIDDTGKEIGITNLDAEYNRLSNMIRDAILPDVTMFVQYELLENKVIKISVEEGIKKPYFLKKHGIKPSGVYVRQGTVTAPASWDLIRHAIHLSYGDSFESKRSLLQDLTFDSAYAEFKNRNVAFTHDKFFALGLRGSVQGHYTNLALILSDQCTHSVKIAVFDDTANTMFKDRREFNGSIFKQLNDSYTYCMLNNRTESIIRGLHRIDAMEYPPEAIREALLNALVHRNYSFSGSIIININAERMEFISLGGLVPGLTTEDILNGISQPRNPLLAQIFFRLKHIEAYGTGLRRIFDLYRDCDRKPTISVTENSFRITLANMNFAKKHAGSAEEVSDDAPGKTLYITDQMRKILDYVATNQEIDEKAVMDLLSIQRTRAYLIAKKMTDIGLLQVQGRGKTKTYRLAARSH